MNRREWYAESVRSHWAKIQANAELRWLGQPHETSADMVKGMPKDPKGNKKASEFNAEDQ